MLHKQLLIKSGSEVAKKSKSFDEVHVPKNKLYHESNVLKSHLTANYDFNTFKEINLAYGDGKRKSLWPDSQFHRYLFYYIFSNFSPSVQTFLALSI